VREDDVEPEELNDDAIELEDGQMVAMAVKELPLVWRTCDAERVTLSEGGAVATKTNIEDEDEYDNEGFDDTLVTSGVELTAGKHYWEVTIGNSYAPVYVGIAKPNLDPNADYTGSWSKDGWFIYTYEGGLCGNGKRDFRNGSRSHQ
jgi:hypothetical protein